MTYSIIDVETTGLSPHNGDRLLEIAVVRLDENGEITNRIDTLINPGTRVGATHIHGISDDMIVNAPAFSDIASFLAKDIAGTVVAAHNARFDMSFLLAEFQRAGYRNISFPALCTLVLARRYFSALESRSLASCRKYLGISDEAAHNALADARATAILLRHFLDNFDDVTSPVVFRLPENLSEEPMRLDDTPRFKSRSTSP